MQNNRIGGSSYQNLIRRSGRSLKSLVITGFFGFFKLFPLHRSWWFGGDVIDHAVDVRDLVYYAVGDAAEYIVVETHMKSRDGKETVTRELFQTDDKTLFAFSCREDGICIKQYSSIVWD